MQVASLPSAPLREQANTEGVSKQHANRAYLYKKVHAEIHFKISQHGARKLCDEKCFGSEIRPHHFRNLALRWCGQATDRESAKNNLYKLKKRQQQTSETPSRRHAKNDSIQNCGVQHGIPSDGATASGCGTVLTVLHVNESPLLDTLSRHEFSCQESFDEIAAKRLLPFACNPTVLRK